MAQREEEHSGGRRTGRLTEGRYDNGDGGPVEANGGYEGFNTTGFVSPAGDALEGPIDLSLLLDLYRPHCYPVRVLGDALPSAASCPATS